MKKLSLLFLTVLCLLGCSPQDVPTAKAQSTNVTVSQDDSSLDTLYTNAVVWTGDSDAPEQRHIGVRNGRLAFLPSEQSFMPPVREKIDINGAFVMPGFMDNHVHFIEGGTALASVDLRDAKTPDLFIQKIADYAKLQPNGKWILNGNWDHEQWGGELPQRDWIDQVTANHPVYVIRIDGHMALANSKALELAGITADTQAPDGGEIIKDEQGQLTGILKGNALNLMLKIIPQPTDDELMQAFNLAQAHALSLGLTHIHAVTAYPSETTMLDIFQMAKARGELKLRAYVSTPIEHLDLASKAIQQSRGDYQLAWGGVKGFVDGSLGARTAWLYEPYTDSTESRGLPLNEPDTLEQWMQDANKRDLRLSIHAIGDHAIDTLLDSFTTISDDNVRAKRYRIEHFQHPSVEAIPRASELGIILSMHPYHAIDDGRWAENRLGPERIKTAYAFRSILDAGGALTFGSDWPVAPLNPLEGVYAAVTRRTTDGKNPRGWLPEQKITLEEALHAYTSTNAYANYLESELGTLSNGKLADFVVLSDDPRKIDPIHIKDIKVLRTVINGKTVFQRGE